MAKDSLHGVIFPAYQVVVMPECFIKTIPVDGLELTQSTLGARLPQHVNFKELTVKMRLENKK